MEQFDDKIPEHIKNKPQGFDTETWAAAAGIRSKTFRAQLVKAINAEKTGKKKYIAHFAFLAYMAGVKDGAELCAKHGTPPLDNENLAKELPDAPKE